MTTESPLYGGRTAEGVMRVGDTVRRPQEHNSAFVHSLLNLLEEKGFEYSPKFLGVDEKNREILTFIEGEVPHGETHWTDEQLVEVVHVLKAFHDTTAGTELAGASEAVCHNDFAPWNVVLRNGKLVGIMDFDGATPGNRSDELAYVLWTFLDLGDDIPIEEQVRKIKLMCDVYGFSDGTKLVNSILSQQEKILAMRKTLAQTAATEEARAFSVERIKLIQSQMVWVKTNREEIENAIRAWHA